MAQPLRVGIIGLGRRWQRRYAPALRALSDLFEVAAVCDQVPHQATVAAARLRCSAAAGPSELIERDDVAAVLLLDLGWQRLWPVGPAARAGKPVFCLPPLEDDEANADTLARQVQEAGLPVMMAAAAAYTPAALRLAELQRERLGPVRLLLCESSEGRPGAADSATLAWLLSVFRAEPVKVTGAGSKAVGLVSLTLEAAGGQVLQQTHWHARGTRSRLRLHLVAEGGQVTLDAPRRLSWDDAEGSHMLTLPRARPIEQILLTTFHSVATGGQAPFPSLGDAHRALAHLRVAARSRAVAP
jgi:predicted dehydrogenase